MRPLAELQAAILLMTRLPAGRVAAPFPALRDCVWALPLAGALVGIGGALVLAGARAAGLPDLMAATLALSVMAVLTGALHEDGLADCADAMGARDPARRHEIMKDSRIGSFGALALILALALRVQGYAALGAAGPGAMIALAMASRAPLAAMLALLPTARADGLGHGAAAPAPARVALALALGAVPALWVGGVAGLLALGGAAALVGLAARRAFGGQSGDVLGAAQQIGEIALLLVLTAGAA